MITSVVAERRSQIVNPLHPRDPGIAAMFGGSVSSSGEVVTAMTAMQEETVLACVRYISETIASLPCSVMRKTDGGRELLDDHWLSIRLGDQFNRYLTSFDGWNLLMNWILLRGNFYVRIEPSRVLPPFELIPLHPDRMEHVERNGERSYVYHSPAGRAIPLRYGEVFHLPFMPDDGWRGKSVIAHQRDTIGRTMATSRYGSKVLQNGGRLGGVLKTKRRLSREAKLALREQWQDRQSGVENAGKVAILDEDMDFQRVAMTNVDAQWLESMQYGVISICRIFNVPPHKVKALEESKWANIEHQQIDAATDTIRPWCVRIEKGAKKDLLTEEERRRQVYVHFNLDALLRGDFKTRQEGLAIQRQWGIISGNDWAAKEDMNPFPGGDVRLVPMNMIPLQLTGQPQLTDDQAQRSRTLVEKRSLQLFQRLRGAYVPIFEDAARRLLRREADSVARQFRREAQSRTAGEFLAWAETFYEEFRGIVEQTMAPVVRSYGEAVAAEAVALLDAEPVDVSAFAGAYASTLAAAHVGRSLRELRELISDTPAQTLPETMEAHLEAWRNNRPTEIAQNEVVQAGNAFARSAWQSAGVQAVRWISLNECELCDPYNGRTVSIREAFDGGLQHPPLHSGCDCQLLPVI